MPKKHPRPSKDRYYLDIALSVSERSTCLRRQYGAVIVRNDEIVATGYNGAARGKPNCCDVHDVCPRAAMAHNSGDYSNCPAVHAEQNALLSAPRSETLDATLYLIGTQEDGDGTPRVIPVCEPCPVCARLLANAGIARVIGPQDLKEGERYA